MFAAGVPLVAGPGVAAGRKDRIADLPAPLRKDVAALVAACRASGGAPQWSVKDLVTTADLSRDGIPDYVIDTHGIQCPEGDASWFGSDGFRYIVWVSVAPGRWVRAWDRRARIFEIDAATSTLLVLSHMAHCTEPNPKLYMRCEQAFVWRDGRMEKLSESWMTE